MPQVCATFLYEVITFIILRETTKCARNSNTLTMASSYSLWIWNSRKPRRKSGKSLACAAPVLCHKTIPTIPLPLFWGQQYLRFIGVLSGWNWIMRILKPTWWTSECTRSFLGGTQCKRYRTSPRQVHKRQSLNSVRPVPRWITWPTLGP